MSKGFGYLYKGTSGHITGVASTLPENPQQLLDNGWEDITHPAAEGTGHMKLKEISTGLTIGFDKGDPEKLDIEEKIIITFLIRTPPVIRIFI